jgi:DNA-directed RNA polymerase subunit RPC12/RpoP
MGAECEIGVVCQHCGRVEKKTIGWLRANIEFLCIRCGRHTEIASPNFKRID